MNVTERQRVLDRREAARDLWHALRGLLESVDHDDAFTNAGVVAEAFRRYELHGGTRATFVGRLRRYVPERRTVR